MKVAVDFFRAETMANLKTVGEYYRRMEDQLGLLRETKEAFLRADCKNWDEWDAESAGFEWTFNQLFPRCLRYSFVVLLYSVVETKLTAFCKELSKRRKVPCPDWNGRKFSLEKCKPFLSKTTGINLKNTLAWNKLTILEKVRNCVTHAGGRVEDSKDRDFLNEAVKAPIGLSIAKHPTSQGLLAIDPKFCADSTKAAIEFFATLFELGEFGPKTSTS